MTNKWHVSNFTNELKLSTLSQFKANHTLPWQTSKMLFVIEKNADVFSGEK